MRQPNSTPNVVPGRETQPKEPAPRQLQSSSLATPPFDQHEAQEHPHGGSTAGAPGQTVESTPVIPHVSTPYFPCSWPGCGKEHTSHYSKKKHERDCLGGSSARLNTPFVCNLPSCPCGNISFPSTIWYAYSHTKELFFSMGAKELGFVSGAHIPVFETSLERLGSFYTL